MTVSAASDPRQAVSASPRVLAGEFRAKGRSVAGARARAAEPLQSAPLVGLGGVRRDIYRMIPDTAAATVAATE